MKTKFISFICLICLVVSCLAPLSVQAADDWRGDKPWSGGGATFKNGVLYLSDGASYSSAYYGSAENYTVRATIRVTKFSS